jgi:hypothetical protein
VWKAAVGHDGRVIAPAQLRLSAEAKLNLLRQLDRWRQWQSLDDRRLCLGCGRLISGHEIEAIQAKEGGLMEVRCPTQGCQSIPLDWILPNPQDRELQQ